MLKKTLFILDSLPKDFAFDATCSYLSLHPGVTQAFREMGGEIDILEDYFDESELARERHDFYTEQVVFFEKLQGFIVGLSVIPDKLKGVHWTALFYHRLKGLFDAMYIQSKMITSYLCQCEGLEKVTYVGLNRNEDYSLFSRPIHYREIVRRWCLGNEVIFESRELKADVAAKASGKTALKSMAFFPDVFKRIKRHWHYRAQSTKSRTWKDMNVLFVHHGSQKTDPVIRFLLAKGANVFLKSGSEITELSKCMQPRVFLNEKSPLAEVSEDELKKLSQESWFFNYLERLSIAHLESVLILYLKNWMKEVVALVALEAKQLVKFYARYKIHYVVAHAATDFAPLSALAAAACSPDVKTVCFEHGMQLQLTETYPLTEFHPFDYYFTGNHESIELLEKLNSWADFIKRTRLRAASHLYAQYRGIISRPSVNGAVVLFLPSKLTSMHRRMMNNTIYPVNWYGDFLRELILDFSKKNFQFVIKSVPRAEWMKDSVEKFIQHAGIRNVSVSYEPLAKWLPRAERVIMDRPTTAFFEVMEAGVPQLCLAHRSLIIPDVSFLANSPIVQPFSGAFDAIQKIDRFLKSESNTYVCVPRSHVVDTEFPDELYESRNEKLSSARFYWDPKLEEKMRSLTPLESLRGIKFL